MGKAIQYRGIDDVMRVHDNLAIVNWAIMYDRNVNAKYPTHQTRAKDVSFADSHQLLGEILKALKIASQQYTVYTLCLYEKLPSGGIKAKSDPDYSFNFSLTDYDDYSRNIGVKYETDALQKKVMELEAKLSKYEQDDFDDEPDSPLMGFLNGIVQDDRFKSRVQDFMFGIADKIFKKDDSPVYPMNNRPQQIPPAKVSGVSDADPILIDQDQHAKLQSAVDVLIRVDPNLGDNLTKIADLARTDKNRYLQLIGMLNNLL